MRAPTSSTIRPYRDRSASAASTTGRSGARPIPPATITMSRPAADGHVPAGAERAAHPDDGCPGCAACSAAVTAPTARRVCCSRPARPSPVSPRPLNEMGTSPMPNAVSMANCPGANAGDRLGRLRQLQGHGVGGVLVAGQPPGKGGASRRRGVGRHRLSSWRSVRGRVDGSGPLGGARIQIQQAQPGRLQPLGDDRRERAAASRTRTPARRRSAAAPRRRRTRSPSSPPGPPHRTASGRAACSHDQPSTVPRVSVSTIWSPRPGTRMSRAMLPSSIEPEPVGPRPRANSRSPAGRRPVRRPRPAPRAAASVSPAKNGWAEQPRGHVARHGLSSSVAAASGEVASADTSWVMSMPVGHHAMHRPQPTQPDEPNWSCQVPSLWVIHCRYRLCPLVARCRRAGRRSPGRSRSPRPAIARRGRR